MNELVTGRLQALSEMCILYINLDQYNSYEKLPPKHIKTYGRIDQPTSITHMQQHAAQTCRQDTFPLIT